MFKKLFMLLVIACSLCATAKEMETIKVVVPYVVGGGPDNVFRILQAYGQRRNINFIPEYKPGANGLIGAEYASKQPPDGRTLMLAVVSDLTNDSPSKKLSYMDFTPMSAICSAHMYLVANKNFPANNITQLTAMLKQNPQAASMVASTISQDTILKQAFSSQGINKEDLLLLTFNLPKGSAALIGGHVDVGLWPAGLIQQLVDNNMIKVLGTYKNDQNIDKTIKYESLADLDPTLNKRMDGYGLFMPKGAKALTVKYWQEFMDDFKADQIVNEMYVAKRCSVYRGTGVKELNAMIESQTQANNKVALTLRQQEIATLIVDRGMSNSNIAKTLNISEGTVKLHVGAIYKKFGVTTRTQLVAFSK